MNKITEWQFEPPTEPGHYLMCYGDIETWANTELVEIVSSSAIPESVTDDQMTVAEIASLISYKWARLAIGTEALT